MRARSFAQLVDAAVIGHAEHDQRSSGWLRTTAVVAALLAGMAVLSVAMILAPWPVAFGVAVSAAAAWCWWLERRADPSRPADGGADRERRLRLIR